jgi:hypothetical protein
MDDYDDDDYEEEPSEMDGDDMAMEVEDEEEDPELFVVDAALPTAAAKSGSENIVFTPIGQGQEAVVEKVIFY